MTWKGASRNGRENIDVSVTPNPAELVCCSSLHFIQAITGGSVVKVRNIDSHWRPPFRFKEIKAIYEPEDGSFIYSSSSIHPQASTGNGSLRDNHIKMEMPSSKQCCSSRESIEDSVTDVDENKFANSCSDKEFYTECSDITLKELRTRCKAKKRKVLKFIGTAESGDRSHQSRTQENDHEQPKEIEFDLQEPLIIFKQKLSKNSMPERKRRKCILSSPSKSAFQVKELNEQEVLFSSSETTQHLKYVETHSMLVHGLSNDNGDPVQFNDIKDEVSVAERYKCPITIDAADCSTSHLSVKTDFSRESSSEVSQRVEGNDLGTGQISSLPKNSPKCHAKEVPTSLSESAEQNFGVTARKDSTEIASYLSSPSLVSDTKNDFFHVKCPELVYSVKNEILEADSWDHQNAVHLTNWSSSGFVDKFNHSGESSFNVLENADGGVFGERHPTSPPNECIRSCTQEVSTKSEEINRHENFIVEGMETSEMTSHVYSLSLASESIINSLFTGNLISDSAAVKLGNETHDDSKCCKIPGEKIACQTVSQNDYSSVDDNGKTINIHSGTDFCASNMADEYIEDLTDEVPAEKEVTVTDYSDVCISIREVEAPGDKNGALAGEMQLNCHKKNTPLYLGSFSELFTNTLCAQNSGQQPTSSDYLPPIDDCLPKTGKDFPSLAGEEVLYAGGDRGVDCLSKFSHSTVVEGITVTEAHENSSQNTQPILSSTDGLLPIGGASCKIEEKLSSPMVKEMLDNCANKTRDHSTVASDSIEGTRLEHQPRKLLSNRKSLSPTSQEKLIQATDAKEQLEKSRKRLWSENLTKDPPLSVSGHGETEVMLSPESMRKHPKKERGGSVPRTTKGILKSPLSSCSNSCSCMEGSSVHMHAQRAIRFSQRQMHDIESIAMKLMKGLKSMKGIAEETLCSEACLSAHSDSEHTADKIRIAVENASELEETTKKWLSMMARDCSRFCKIMHRSTGVRKRRKKIIFADEVGGMLCHVKVFLPAFSDVDSESEKANQQTASIVDSECGDANQNNCCHE